jgi:hypothetical protein
MADTMHFSLWLALTVLLLVIGAQLLAAVQLAALRRAGHYPMRGQAVMADVERLLKSGHRSWAVRCYREIHACSLRQARDAVETLAQR